MPRNLMRPLCAFNDQNGWKCLHTDALEITNPVSQPLTGQCKLWLHCPPILWTRSRISSQRGNLDVGLLGLRLGFSGPGRSSRALMAGVLRPRERRQGTGASSFEDIAKQRIACSIHIPVTLGADVRMSLPPNMPELKPGS